MENTKGRFEIWLQIGLSIPILTFIAYGAIYYYQAGYFDFYKIPKSFIEVELSNNFPVIFSCISLVFMAMFIAYIVSYFSKPKTGINLFVAIFVGIFIINFCFKDYSDTILPLIITSIASFIVLVVGTANFKFKHLGFFQAISPDIIKAVSIPVIFTTLFFIVCYHLGNVVTVPLSEKHKKYNSKNVMLVKYSDCLLYGVPDSLNKNNISALVYERGKDADTIILK
jgi:hypothetical protein